MPLHVARVEGEETSAVVPLLQKWKLKLGGSNQGSVAEFELIDFKARAFVHPANPGKGMRKQAEPVDWFQDVNLLGQQ